MSNNEQPTKDKPGEGGDVEGADVNNATKEHELVE